MSARPPALPAWRVAGVGLALGLAFCVVALRAYELQVRDREFLTYEGERRHVRTLIEPGGRGAIVDRHGAALALSAPVESIWAVPAELLARPEYIAPLARLLGESERALESSLMARAERDFLYLKRQLAPAEARRVLALGAPGVFSQREYRRYYPAGETVAQLVGFADIDGRGQEGIERAFDEQLAGAAGQRRVIKDRQGNVVEDLAEFVPAEPGREVRLSVDLRLQHFAYRELKDAVSKHRARGGVVVVVDVRSGEILALATQPGFNPNDRAHLSAAPAAWRNRAALDIFEPGSTIKPLLVAAALSRGVIEPGAHIDTSGGTMRVGGLQVRDFRSYGTIDLETLLAKSSNVGAARLGLKLGAQRLFEAYRDLGFGDAVGVGIPGESSGQLRGWDEWGQVGTATASYGYGVGVTALQLARAYLALAADGRLRTLSLLADGAPAAEERQVIDPLSAEQVRRLMTAVTGPTGTGSRGAVDGYAVAGKTGTVRKVVNGEYLDDLHQSLFVGMLPAQDPRLLALVMIDEPSAGAIYGGAVAAPVFSRVAASAARLLQVAPRRLPGRIASANDGAPS